METAGQTKGMRLMITQLSGKMLMVMDLVTTLREPNGIPAQIDPVIRPRIASVVPTMTEMAGPTISMNAHHWPVRWITVVQTLTEMVG